VTKKDIIFFSS